MTCQRSDSSRIFFGKLSSSQYIHGTHMYPCELDLYCDTHASALPSVQSVLRLVIVCDLIVITIDVLQRTINLINGQEMLSCLNVNACTFTQVYIRTNSMTPVWDVEQTFTRPSYLVSALHWHSACCFYWRHSCTACMERSCLPGCVWCRSPSLLCEAECTLVAWTRTSGAPGRARPVTLGPCWTAARGSESGSSRLLCEGKQTEK